MSALPVRGARLRREGGLKAGWRVITRGAPQAKAATPHAARYSLCRANTASASHCTAPVTMAARAHTPSAHASARMNDTNAAARREGGWLVCSTSGRRRSRLRERTGLPCACRGDAVRACSPAPPAPASPLPHPHTRSMAYQALKDGLKGFLISSDQGKESQSVREMLDLLTTVRMIAYAVAHAA